MLELVRYRTKPMQSGIFLVRYRTKLTDAGMPMTALVFWMPMPSYAKWRHYRRCLGLYSIFQLVVIARVSTLIGQVKRLNRILDVYTDGTSLSRTVNFVFGIIFG
jgi:hypothetical protein